MNEQGNVSLTISKDIVNPIVETKIKEAILSAMGGQDEILKKILDQIMYQKVNSEGRVSSYSSENKYPWIDILISQKIQDAVKLAITELFTTKQDVIKAEIIKKLMSKTGAEKFASALLSANSQIANKYATKITVSFGDKLGD